MAALFPSKELFGQRSLPPNLDQEFDQESIGLIRNLMRCSILINSRAVQEIIPDQDFDQESVCVIDFDQQ